MTKRPAPEGTQAVIRAIRLLKAFSRTRPERSLAGLSNELGLTKTTAHRLLSALESEGLVERNLNAKTFRLGPAILALGAQAIVTNDLRSIVEPELRDLAARTGETATLEVLVEGTMLIVAEVLGSHLVTVTAELGTRWPIHATSTGKAYLSTLAASEAEQLLVKPLSQHTPDTIVEIAVLEKELDVARTRGYATTAEELEIGASAVGTVLRNAIGTPVGAISLGGPSSRLTSERMESLGRELIAAARRLAPLIHTRG